MSTDDVAAHVVVAVLGVGEAGSEIARDLVAAGSWVRTYDPLAPTVVEGALACADEADAVRGADLVLSVNSAADAPAAFKAGLLGVTSDTVWADLNTAPSELKRRLAERADAAGVAFADVALMSPVPGLGLRTPMLASGTGAADFHRMLWPYGARVDLIDGPAGAAADRKLLRSVFYKGLAAAVLEALEAGRAAGCESWLRGEIAAELAQAGAATVDRLEQGSYRHAVRRSHEMAAAETLLHELNVPADVCSASRAWLERLAAHRGE